MNKNKKRTQYVGIGLILGTAIGSVLDFNSGNFSGISAGTGAGLGILTGAICYYYKFKNVKKNKVINKQ